MKGKKRGEGMLKPLLTWFQMLKKKKEIPWDTKNLSQLKI